MQTDLLERPFWQSISLRFFNGRGIDHENHTAFHPETMIQLDLYVCEYRDHVYKETSEVALASGAKTLGKMLSSPRRIMTIFALKLSTCGHRDYLLWYCTEYDEM